METNFRLLFEDFFHDTRRAIKILSSGQEQDDLHFLVNVFRNVSIDGYFAAEGFFGFCLKIHVGFPKRDKFTPSWTFGKKLKYGNLVLFTDA